MFDISFSELLMIAVVALLVIGPDKLPKVARTVGAYVGRLQRYASQIKEEVNREVRFEELQNLQEEIKQGVHQAESSMMAGTHSVKETLKSVKETAKSQSATKKKPAVKKAGIKENMAKKSTAKSSPAKKTTAKASLDKA